MHLVIPLTAAGIEPPDASWRDGLTLPRLQALVAHAQPLPPVTLADDDPATAAEHVQAAALGWTDGTAWAAREAQRLGQEVGDRAWAFVTPCHWTLGQSQVTLDDPAQLALDEAESQALREAMQPYFAQDELTLLSAQPHRWLVHGEEFRDLVLPSMDRVVGLNMRAWQPGSGLLRRLQTEMQMLLYNHPVNEARSARGLPTVNALWFSGSGTARAVTGTEPEPLVVHDLERAARSGDAGAWRSAWQAIDAEHGAALHAALARGEDACLTLCGARSLRTLHARPRRGALSLLTGLLARRTSLPALMDALCRS